jgi:hypothetical protein
VLGFISLIKPTSVDEALLDDGWITVMQEDLNQLQRNDVWDMVARLDQKNIIGTNWVFKNKLSEQGEVVRNKAQLVAQGYNNQEGIYFPETFARVAIRGNLTFSLLCINHDIILYQMDVKSAFLNILISEDVSIKQPHGFEDSVHLDYVFKLKKSLYGLKQAPRA